MLTGLTEIKQSIAEKRPLIHCITSPIAINDCANAVLAVGAQPIMAEHPAETAGITATAKALTVSLANITDARLASMMLSGRKASECGIPSLIDAVGVTCSPMRLETAKEFIRECRPAVIKGNANEIRALAGASFDAASGVDAGAFARDEMERLVKRYAEQTGCVVMMTGAVDLISDGAKLVRVANGHPKMSRVTGTGCVLTCIAGAYLSAAEPLTASVFGVLNWGTAGEKAAELAPYGLGSYHTALLDALSELDGETLCEMARVEVV